MKKLLLATAAVITASSITLNAKDLSVNVPPVHDLWWNAPEQPSFNVTVRDTLGNANKSRLSVLIDSDRKGALATQRFDLSLNVAAGDSATVTIYPTLAPGFYRCSVVDDGNVIKTFNIGYEPENVVSLPDYQADFKEFWDKARAELATVAPQYTLKEIPEKSGKKRKIYEVTMHSLGDEVIKGEIAIPVKKGKYPAQIFYQGYGSKPWMVGADDRPDWIELCISSRGQFMSEPDNHFGDWIRYNLANPDEYYYRGAFMDCIRAIDFIYQLDKTDTRNIFAEGGSQGGAYTLAAAALDNRLTAIAPYIPFLSDYPDYFNIVNWPAAPVKEEAQIQGLSDEQLYRNLSYFDIKNLARWITCPVLMGVGLQDPTCPPHTNFSGYNLITSPKEFVIYPLKGHTVDYSDWNPRRSTFFEKWSVK